jgi:glutaredoxin-related protein
MKKNLRIGLVIISLIVVASLLALAKSKQVKSPESILFYSNYCPHCKNVEKYVNDNNVKSKVTFTELEVADNADNAQVLFNKAKKCNLDTNNLGVPMYFDGEKCLVGDEEIIKYFETK